jgi:hypothetical protein
VIPLDQTVINRFCAHVSWAEQAWLLRRHLFPENKDVARLFEGPHRYFFTRLQIILQEFWLSEVAKLHDPPMQAKRTNLCVDYVLEGGTWSTSTRATLKDLRDRMATFAAKIKDARNRLLAHNDLEVILSGDSLGTFEDGDDVAYFEALRAFAELAHQELTGKSFAFDKLTPNDVATFMAAFEKQVA